MEVAPDAGSELASALELKGRTVPWGIPALAVLVACAAVGLWFRLHGLAQEGFSDDELHKWLSANRYLQGDFGGDDLEHPMLMKSLIALTLIVGRKLQWAPETITRLPNAIVASVAVILVALLGRRLFGRTAGLFAAAIGAVSVTWIGYQRIAKEDVLVGVFLMVLCLCLAEAKAAADNGEKDRSRRFEVGGAAALAAMLASKYYPHQIVIPVLAVFWLARTNTAYRVPLRRWLQLIGISLVIWISLNWMAVLPSTWKYIFDYVRGATHGGRATHLTMLFMGRLYPNVFQAGLFGMPPWYFLVFAAVKQTPGVVLFSAAGLVWAIWKRHPSQRLMLTWMAVLFAAGTITGAKYARMFLPVFPAFFLLAGSTAAWLIERARNVRLNFASTGLAALLAAVLIGPELLASTSHAPHFRTYISPLGGGDRLVTWYFPHCDYFDAGYREAIEYIAQHAEPGAEISTEIDWTALYYAQRFGRGDLVVSMTRPEESCHHGRICYVAIQTGRFYQANQRAVEKLAQRQPWHVVRIRGVDVVKVYRLPPGESPFPSGAEASSR